MNRQERHEWKSIVHFRRGPALLLVMFLKFLTLTVTHLLTVLRIEKLNEENIRFGTECGSRRERITGIENDFNVICSFGCRL